MTHSNKSILVTGGAGFIGSNLVDDLLANGANVTVVDNFASGTRQNVVSHVRSKRYQLVELDIRDISRLREKLTGEYDAIVHLAGKAGVRPSVSDPASYQESNVGGTQNMLELARERGVKQFVFSSSSSVYGVNSNMPWSEDDHVLLPASPYASTKVSAELLGHVYSHLHGIRFIALRLFTVYGPRQRPDLAIHKFIRYIRGGSPIPVYGDGSTRRDYTYVADIVAGINAAMEYEGSDYEVINLGSGSTISLSEMIETMEDVFGIQMRRRHLPEQPGDLPRTWADIQKARDLLGYQPTTDFRAGLEAFRSWLEKKDDVHVNNGTTSIVA